MVSVNSVETMWSKCNQCRSAGSNISWGLNFRASVCNFSGVRCRFFFSGHSIFHPSFISQWFNKWNKKKINTVLYKSVKNNSWAVPSLHVAHDMCVICTWCDIVVVVSIIILILFFLADKWKQPVLLRLCIWTYLNDVIICYVMLWKRIIFCFLLGFAGGCNQGRQSPCQRWIWTTAVGELCCFCCCLIYDVFSLAFALCHCRFHFCRGIIWLFVIVRGFIIVSVFYWFTVCNVVSHVQSC